MNSHALSALIRGAPEQLRQLIDELGDRLHDLWAWHTERLRESEAYRNAIAAGVTAILAEITLGPAATAVITAIVTAYAAAYASGAFNRRYGYHGPRWNDEDDLWT